MAVFGDEGWGVADRDEFLRPDTTVEALAGLKTPFRAHGRVTAGNAAGLNDGATACLLAAAETAEELGLEAKMRLVGFAFAGVEPEVMGIGPIPATKASRAGRPDDRRHRPVRAQRGVRRPGADLVRGDGIAPDDPRVNPYGGAIACGHPLASSGVRLMTQLAYGFEEHPEVRYGLTAMCIGLGMGATLIWENVSA